MRERSEGVAATLLVMRFVFGSVLVAWSSVDGILSGKLRFAGVAVGREETSLYCGLFPCGRVAIEFLGACTCAIQRF